MAHVLLLSPLLRLLQPPVHFIRKSCTRIQPTLNRINNYFLQCNDILYKVHDMFSSTSTSTIPYYFYYLEVRIEAFANIIIFYSSNFTGISKMGPASPVPLFNLFYFISRPLSWNGFSFPSLPPSSQNNKTSTQSQHLLLKITKRPTREKLQDRQSSLLLHVPALPSPLISFCCFIFSFAFVVVVFGELYVFLLLNLYYFLL